jgi:hypothetical protein
MDTYLTVASADFATALELERHRHLVALLEIALEAQEHDVVTPRLHLDLASGGHVDLGHRTHLHHAAVVLHFMQLNGPGHVARCREQRIGLRAGIGHRDVDGSIRALDLPHLALLHGALVHRPFCHLVHRACPHGSASHVAVGHGGAPGPGVRDLDGLGLGLSETWPGEKRRDRRPDDCDR